MLLYIVQNNQQMNILYFINIKYRYTVQVHITEGFDWSFLTVHNHIILRPNKEEQVPWSEVKLTVEIQEEWSKKVRDTFKGTGAQDDQPLFLYRTKL